MGYLFGDLFMWPCERIIWVVNIQNMRQLRTTLSNSVRVECFRLLLKPDAKCLCSHVEKQCLVWNVLGLLFAKQAVSLYCNVSNRDTLPYSYTAVEVLDKVIKISIGFSGAEERSHISANCSPGTLMRIRDAFTAAKELYAKVKCNFNPSLWAY